MTFGEAIEALKTGKSISRIGWTGAKMWLILVKPSYMGGVGLPYIALSIENPDSLHIVDKLQPWVGGSATAPDIVPWVASHADLLAEDWFVPEKVVA